MVIFEQVCKTYSATSDLEACVKNMTRPLNDIDITNLPRIDKLGIVGSCVAIIALVFSSLRGWAVLNLEIPTYVVYGSSSILIVALSVCGFVTRKRFKTFQLVTLRNSLLINLILGLWFLTGEFLLGGKFDASYAYLFLLPYIVFIFFRVPVSGLHIAFNVIAIVISFSVISNFIISMNAGGLEYLLDYNTKLYPDSFKAMSRSGEYLRVGGYIGNYHDAANILGMLSAYYFVKFLIDREITKLMMAIIVVVAMAFTQSTANIILAIATCLIFALYVVIRKGNFSVVILFLAVVFLIAFVVMLVPETLVFTGRVVNPDFKGMATSLSVNMLFAPYFWVGHGYAFNSEFVDTEVALLKAILQLGLAQAAILYWILIYPIYIFVKNKSHSLTPLPYLAAIFFGFFSLLHYGSLFRSTNIVLFYAMYTLALSVYNSDFNGHVQKAEQNSV